MPTRPNTVNRLKDNDWAKLLNSAAARAAGKEVRRGSLRDSDLQSEVAIRLLRYRQTSLTVEEFQALAGRIARNCLTDRVRREIRAQRGLGVYHRREPIERDLPSEHADDAAYLRERFLEVLRTIRDSSRLVLWMRFADGATLHQIAAASGLSVTTVRRRLEVARSEMRARLVRLAIADGRLHSILEVRGWL